MKMQRFDRELPAAAQGNYHSYHLFMERALHILKPGGRFGLLAGDTCIDKEWVQELCEHLATGQACNT
jgi:hypothetical protein